MLYDFIVCRFDFVALLPIRKIFLERKGKILKSIGKTPPLDKRFQDYYISASSTGGGADN